LLNHLHDITIFTDSVSDATIHVIPGEPRSGEGRGPRRLSNAMCFRICRVNTSRSRVL
jgi:hypothetical protein